MENRRHNSLQYRLLSNYMLLTLILITLAAVTIFFMQWKFAVDEYESSNKQKLEQLQGSLDERIYAVQAVGSNMALNASLRPEAVLRDENKLDTLRAVGPYGHITSMMDTFLIGYWDARINCVISPNHIYNEQFFDSAFSSYGLTISDMREIMGNNTTPSYSALPSGSEAPTHIIYAFPISSASTYARVTVFFMFRMSDIIEQVRSVFPDELARVSILVADGSSIYDKSFGDGSSDMTAYAAHSASFSSLKLTVYLRPSPMLSHIGALQIWLMIFAVVAIVVGLGLSAILARRVYTPIHQLRTRMLDGDEVEGALNTFSELDEIEGSYRRVTLERAELATQVKQQSSLLKSNLLSLLVEGGADDAGARALAEELGRGMGADVFALVYVLLDRRNAFSSMYDQASQCEIERVLVAALDIVGQADCILSDTVMRPNKTALMLLSCPAGGPREEIIARIRRMQREILESTEESVSVVLGESFLDLAEIGEQYAQVQSLAGRRILLGWNCVIDAAEPGEMLREGVGSADMGLLKRACAAGEAGAAEREMRRAIGSISIRADMFSFKYAYFKLAGAVHSIAEEVLSDEVFSLEAHPEPETLSEAEELLVCMVKEVCERISARGEAQRSDLCRDVYNFLSDNFGDSSLSLTSICDRFNVSQSHLNRLFKQRYGTSVASMLDQMRMREVKRLLTESRLMVKEIIAEVGYTDVNNFIRKFKALEGETPLVYRKRHASPEQMSQM